MPWAWGELKRSKFLVAANNDQRVTGRQTGEAVARMIEWSWREAGKRLIVGLPKNPSG